MTHGGVSDTSEMENENSIVDNNLSNLTIIHICTARFVRIYYVSIIVDPSRNRSHETLRSYCYRLT